jgi:CO/xanthine dehydrogenase FAD-binding subunit
MEYLRPKTIDEALGLLAEGIPLAGGTQLTVDRYGLSCVIDLQSLGLDDMREQDSIVYLGAMTRLQSMLTADISMPDALQEACRYEAAWNIRNQATLGGVLMRADGRSPLMTVLTVLDPQITLAPGKDIIGLVELFERRQSIQGEFIIIEMSFLNPACLAYDYVARAPMDAPIVSAAAAISIDEKKVVKVSIGGFGDHPISWTQDINEVDHQELLEAVGDTARERFQDADDAFASAEYRAEIAGILSQRVVSEVLEAC